MTAEPVRRELPVRPIAWVAMFLSVVTAVITWIAPLLQITLFVNSVFGEASIVPPLILVILTVGSLVLDIIAITKKRWNIAAGVVGILFILSLSIPEVIFHLTPGN
jgi:hypothetical protein